MITPAEDDIAQLIRGRRTIHEFTAEVVPKSLIMQGLELARWAPNHHLTEPWRFYLPGPDTVAGIVDLNAELVRQKKGGEAAELKRQRWAKMPGWLVMTCVRSDDALQQQEDYAATCCAAQNLQLWLASQGVGMKWSTGGVIRDSRFYDLMWIDEALEQVVGLFWYGRAAETPEPGRKPLEQLVIELP